MSARTIAAKMIAAQKDIATAKQLGINAALKDDVAHSQQALVGLSRTFFSKPAMLAIAEGAYFAKLQDLRGEASA
jgi:hypothetical protein